VKIYPVILAKLLVILPKTAECFSSAMHAGKYRSVKDGGKSGVLLASRTHSLPIIKRFVVLNKKGALGDLKTVHKHCIKSQNVV
jgi:hypothetical protein